MVHNRELATQPLQKLPKASHFSVRGLRFRRLANARVGGSHPSFEALPLSHECLLMGQTSAGHGNSRWKERIKKDVTCPPRARYRSCSLAVTKYGSGL